MHHIRTYKPFRVPAPHSSRDPARQFGIPNPRLSSTKIALSGMVLVEYPDRTRVPIEFVRAIPRGWVSVPGRSNREFLEEREIERKEEKTLSYYVDYVNFAATQLASLTPDLTDLETKKCYIQDKARAGGVIGAQLHHMIAELFGRREAQWFTSPPTRRALRY